MKLFKQNNSSIFSRPKSVYIQSDPLERTIRFVHQSCEISHNICPGSDKTQKPSVERYNEDKVVWRVSGFDVQDFLVHLQRFGAEEIDRWVVIVDSKKFYAGWLSTKGESWGHDKFPKKVSELKNFSSIGQDQNWYERDGLALPRIFFNSGDRSFIAIGDGRHRASWLISHSRFFPVEVISTDQIDLFCRLFGADGCVAVPATRIFEQSF